MLESNFKKRLIEEIEYKFPGAIVLRLDTSFIQGIPDHLILYGNRWAAFEAKRNADASHRINQDYYIDLFNKMSYASFVYPENKEKFLYEIQRSFKFARTTRFPIRKQISLG